MTPARILTPRRGQWILRCGCGSTWAAGPSLEAVRESLVARHRQLIPRCHHIDTGIVVGEVRL